MAQQQPAEVTADHIERAKRMIGCGLDVGEVSQWLANVDADKAEIKRSRAALLSIVGRGERGGPGAAVCVTVSTLVAIAKQALVPPKQ